MDERIIRRIERQLGIPGVVEALGELPPADLQSLLLELNRKRCENKEPASLLKEWEENRFVRPAAFGPRAFLSVESAFLEALTKDVEALTLSPVAPLGACSVVATVNQHKVLSADRGTEVMADATNVLALECAVRRRALLREDARSRTPVSLAAYQRMVRAQALSIPGLVPHFGLVALCTAGRDEGAFRFELAALRRQFGILVRWTMTIDPTAELDLRVTPLEPGPSEETLERELLTPLQNEHPTASASIDNERETGRGYYECLCFKLHARIRRGDFFELADGGATNWTAQLLSNRKERLVISGAGMERLVAGIE